MRIPCYCEQSCTTVLTTMCMGAVRVPKFIFCGSSRKCLPLLRFSHTFGNLRGKMTPPKKRPPHWHCRIGTLKHGLVTRAHPAGWNHRREVCAMEQKSLSKLRTMALLSIVIILGMRHAYKPLLFFFKLQLHHLIHYVAGIIGIATGTSNASQPTGVSWRCSTTTRHARQ